MDMDEQFAIVGHVDAWLDRAVAQQYKDQPLAQDWARVGKMTEESGEAVAALIDCWLRLKHLEQECCTGQNPRKGVHGSQDDLLKELADMAVGAMYAIQHFTKDRDRTRDIITETLVAHSLRAGEDWSLWDIRSWLTSRRSRRSPSS